MKKIICILLTLSLLFMFACSNSKQVDDNNQSEQEEQEEDKKEDEKQDEEIKYDPMNLEIPTSSTVFDKQFAKNMLTLCSGHYKENSAKLLESAGFEVVVQKHFEKSYEDSSHNSAFSIGKKVQVINEVERQVYIVTIRGTNGGEWISNFDFAPSMSNTTIYAENFFYCAQDILKELKSCITDVSQPIILISGHSRGAACANLLGYLVDMEYPVKDVYVYTYATPTTIRNISTNCKNIFNIINTSDVVTKVPLESMGYTRVGQDLKGSVTNEYDEFISNSFSTLNSICTTISSYYNDKHSLTTSGLSDDGVTVFQLLTYLTTFLSYSTTGIDLSKSSLANISSDSDFYPLVGLIDEGLKNNLASNILLQHMPDVYMTIIDQL